MAEAIFYTLERLETTIKALGSQAGIALASALNFKSDLERLETSIKSIKNVLLDAEERQFEDRTVKFWLRKLRAVLYEVEDLLEDIVASSAAWQGKSFATKVKLFFSSSNKLYQGCRISHQIKKIRKNLDDIYSDSQRYSFIMDAPNLMRRREGGTDSFIDEKEVIGRDADKKIIMDMLFDVNVPVICIVGMAGLGKTDLAKLVFNDSVVKERFKMRLWVRVAEEFRSQTIIQRVLKSAAPDEPCDEMGMDELRRGLQEKILGKRYLLVLDDVWIENSEEWLKVRRLLGTSGDGSKILVTTRLQRVADIMVDGTTRHKLEGLSPEESWSLFEKLAFVRGQEQNARFVELGKHIVKKCWGVPLTIRVLAGYLYAQDEGKWLSVKDKELSQIEDEVVPNLKLSDPGYLQCELKQCFGYCSLFPKDTRMEKVTLINLWMAQGFFLSSDNQSLEETGEEYFTELVWRGFFQDIEKDEKGDIQYCKMDYLMHGRAQRVSEGKIMSAIKGRTTLEKGVSHVSFEKLVPSEISTTLSSVKSLRTLVLNDDLGDVFSVLLSSLRRLRVLQAQNASIRTVPRSIGKLIHLRYLCLSHCSIETLPDSIGNLLNLQTLKLAKSKLKALPSVIERLTSLRLLDLSCSYDLMSMAADISKLTNLRHLDLSHCHQLTGVAADISSLTNLELLDLTGCRSLDQMPSGTEQLTKLRTLPWFIVGIRNADYSESRCGLFRDLKDLNSLRGELCIRILCGLRAEQRQSNAANLRGKAGLLKLHVMFNCEDDEAIMEALGLQPHPDLKELVIENYGGLRLPRSMDQLNSALPNLVDIQLENCSRCKHLPSFAQLASLRKLFLCNCPDVEYIESSIGYESVMPLFFPSLENLSLICMRNMKGWWKGEERGEGEGSEIFDQPWQLDASNPRPLLPSFPKLSRLEIRSCPSLTCSPASLSPYVEELELTGVDEKMLSMLNSALPNLVRCRHLPSFALLASLMVVLFGVGKKMLSMLKGQMAITVAERQRPSNLKILLIRDLTTLKSFPRDCFKGLLSLQSLQIDGLHQLQSLSSSGLEYLTGLKKLTISDCSSLDLSDDEMMSWEALKSLRHLELRCISPKMSTVPAGFQHLTVLESLLIEGSGELGALPELVISLPSLNHINGMMPCEALKSLRHSQSRAIPKMSTVP